MPKLSFLSLAYLLQPFYSLMLSYNPWLYYSSKKSYRPPIWVDKQTANCFRCNLYKTLLKSYTLNSLVWIVVSPSLLYLMLFFLKSNKIATNTLFLDLYFIQTLFSYPFLFFLLFCFTAKSYLCGSISLFILP